MGVTAPPRPPAIRAPADRRPRWPTRLLVTTMASLTVSVSLALAWAARYQPLHMDGGLFLVSPPARFVTSTAPPYGGPGFDVYEVDYVEGGSIRLGFTLHNRGPLPVRVTAVGVDPSEDPHPTGPLQLAGVALRRPEGAEPAFRASTLPPDGRRPIVTTWRFTGSCPPEEGPATTQHGQIGVRYRFLWFERVVLVPLPYTLQVHQGLCPIR